MKAPHLRHLIHSLTLLVVITTAQAATVEFPQYGFSIEPLDSALPAAESVTALSTYLPATNGFAPNINVQIQPYSGSIQDYAKLSRDQITQMKWNLISDEIRSKDEWVLEYEGTVQGNSAHFYGRAISKNGKVYLATATASPAQWTTLGTLLKKHVDSLQAK